MQFLAFVLACVGTSQPGWFTASRGTTAPTGEKVMYIGLFATCTEVIPEQGCYQMTCVPHLGTKSFTFDDMNYRPLGVTVTNLNTQMTLDGVGITLEARRDSAENFCRLKSTAMGWILIPAYCSASL